METIELNKTNSSQNVFLNDYVVLCFFALLKLLIHLAANLMGGYGYFRDELYYIACSDHMAWGYVDQPPFSIAVLWISRLFFGDSLFAIRLFPAIAGALTVAVSVLMAREIGGKRFAQILTACAVIIAPLTIGTSTYFSMNSFDLLFWSLVFYLIILIMKNDNQKMWILLGLVLGFGLLNKISVLWLGAGLCIGMLFTPYRKLFLTRRVWIAAAIALIVFLPHIIWQVLSGFPTLEFIKNATSHKYIAVSPLGMFVQQILSMNPVSFPIWFAGLIYFMVSKSIKPFRILPYIYLIVFLILVVNRNSKAEYLGPMFPMLLALGAFATEKFILRLNWVWIKPVVTGLLTLSGIALAPFSLAVLPVETFITYSYALGITPSTPEKKKLNSLPQYYADMFGWEKMTAAVADAYYSLTPEAKAECVILCNNYGEAGAIDFFGRKYDLPKAISGHNNYWLWGCQNSTGKVVIRLGGSMDAILRSYTTVMQVEVFSDEYCMPYENNMPVYICLDRKTPLKDDWAGFKHFE